MTESAKIWKILPHKNALKPWFSWKIWWGSKKPLKFSRFLLLRKKNFAYFAWNLKNSATFCHGHKGEALKNLIFWGKSVSVSDFYQFCHFRTPISPTFCQNTKVKPWKIWFSKEISKFYQLFGKIQGFEAFYFLFPVFWGEKTGNFFSKFLLKKAHFRFLKKHFTKVY